MFLAKQIQQRPELFPGGKFGLVEDLGRAIRRHLFGGFHQRALDQGLERLMEQQRFPTATWP